MSPIWRWSSKILAVILLVGPHVVRSNLKVKEVNPFMIAPNDNVKTADIITTEKKVTEEPGESSPGLRTMNRELDEDSEEASPLVEDTSEEPTTANPIESGELSLPLGIRPHRGWGPYGYPPPGFTSGGREPQWDRHGDKNPKLNRLAKCLGHPEKSQLLKVMKDIKKWIKMLDHDRLTSESPKSAENLSRVVPTLPKLPYRERALKKIADLIRGKEGLLSSSPYGSFEFRSREEDHQQDSRSPSYMSSFPFDNRQFFTHRSSEMEHGHNKHDIRKMWCLFEAFKYEDSVGMKDMLLALQQRITADKTLLREIYQRRKNQVKLIKKAMST